LLVNDILKHRLELFVSGADTTKKGTTGKNQGTDEEMDETSHNEDWAGWDNADD
jgi:hypothetical protein